MTSVREESGGGVFALEGLISPPLAALLDPSKTQQHMFVNNRWMQGGC